MTTRSRLLTSIPFWILLAGSVASGVIGLWIVLGTLPSMETGLTDGSATTAQVYGGQSWVVVGSALLAAGVVGVVLALAVAALASLAPAAAPAVIDEIEEIDEVETAPATTAVPVPDAAPVAEAPGENPDVEVPSDAPAPDAARRD